MSSDLSYESCIKTIGGEAQDVSDYYGEVLQQSSDLKTNACCTIEEIPLYMKKALNNIHDDVMMKYYGCGLVHPENLSGASICDLGCGAGRDCYILSQLVGEEGRVVGVDFTEDQLKVARDTETWHMEKFGYKKSNVEFLSSFIESMPLEDQSFDVIVSNCVVNLSPDKKAVLMEAYRLLKPGGEMFFSDVYSSSRIPLDLKKDPVLWGECLSGCLYWNDFLRLAKECGFKDPRLVKDAPITIENDAMKTLLGPIEFFSATYRMFKIDELEPDCEDYGQAVIYKGNIKDHPYVYALDSHHKIKTGKVFPVCGNSYRMLKDTRFASAFEFIGDFSRHYGLFEGCGKGIPFKDSTVLDPNCCN
mmetsp:Transcript_29592/g.28321  ORF Transcript_29592/g.28321 Transcript_29592/m.28321 type:complete len:361 (+) Transcript_29592:103-1185(+)